MHASSGAAKIVWTSALHRLAFAPVPTFRSSHAAGEVRTVHAICKAALECRRSSGGMIEVSRLSREKGLERALRIADVAAEEIVRSEGEPTGAPDEFRIPQCQADYHIRECIGHLEYRDMAISTETEDGYLVVQLVEENSDPFW
jgi:hypothetical protein